MKTETKHTPGPWKYSTNVGPTKALIVEPDGTTIFEAFNRTNDTRFGKNIAFMIESCNNYERVKAQRDELAAALKIFAIVGGAKLDDNQIYIMSADDIRRARAALAKLEDKNV